MSLQVSLNFSLHLKGTENENCGRETVSVFYKKKKKKAKDIYPQKAKGIYPQNRDEKLGSTPKYYGEKYVYIYEIKTS